MAGIKDKITHKGESLMGSNLLSGGVDTLNEIKENIWSCMAISQILIP
jgi:hypothetical protein